VLWLIDDNEVTTREIKKHMTTPALLLLGLFLTTGVTFSQDSVNSPEFKAGPFRCTEVMGRMYCMFQNAKYSQIVDIEGISLDSKIAVKEFCDDIQEAYQYITNGNTAQGNWNPKGVSAMIHAPWAGQICVWTDDGYALISPREKDITAVINGMNSAAVAIWGE
jgi:hypothetical protein